MKLTTTQALILKALDDDHGVSDETMDLMMLIDPYFVRDLSPECAEGRWFVENLTDEEQLALDTFYLENAA